MDFENARKLSRGDKTGSMSKLGMFGCFMSYSRTLSGCSWLAVVHRPLDEVQNGMWVGWLLMSTEMRKVIDVNRSGLCTRRLRSLLLWFLAQPREISDVWMLKQSKPQLSRARNPLAAHHLSLWRLSRTQPLPLRILLEAKDAWDFQAVVMWAIT